MINCSVTEYKCCIAANQQLIKLMEEDATLNADKTRDPKAPETGIDNPAILLFFI